MRLIRGAPGTGKTALIFREFNAAVRAGRDRLRIVAPTATLVRHYQHELARSGLVFDPGMVVSLSRFAADCAPQTPLVSAALLGALVRDALRRLPLPEFAQAAETRGMADVVLETMTRFENAACDPERLARVRRLSPLGQAFLRVWQDVAANVAARGFVTRGPLFRLAAKSVPPGTVWFDGFLNFSPLERELLRATDAACELTLTLSDGQLAELGAAHLRLTGAPRSPGTVAVLAASPEREADEMARRILELHARGTDFPAIAVALRDVDGWLPLLRTTFDRFGIPARFYFSWPVRKHPVAVFLNGLIGCALGDWDFASTLAALRAHPAWGCSADFDRFDFRVREAMPGHGADALLALCESDWLRTRMADCLKIAAWKADKLRPELWRRRFTQLAESLYRPRTIEEPADYAALEADRGHAAALRAWTSALDVAVDVAASGDGALVSLEQFHNAVTDALEDIAMQIPDDRHNAVHVMSAFEARQWQVRALFVCGMSARDYPRRAAENLLFPDSDIVRLRQAGIPLRDSADDDRDEDALFELLQSRASETLVLSRSERDAAGRTMVASRHFTGPAAGARAVRVAARCAPPVPLPVPGRIGDASLAAFAAHHGAVNLTSLEDLAKCRFRFFAKRSLSLKTVPERPEERLGFSAQGLIVHEAMEHWLGDRTQDFVGLFETTFDEFCRKRHIQPGYRLEVKRVELRRVANKVNESVSWPVERSETEADVSLNFPGGITVSGRVDRIDHLANGDCVIIDYKSGKVQNVKKLVERETSLQGPLYALAVRENKGLNPVAMVFLAIRENKIFGWGSIPGAAELNLMPVPEDWIDSARDRTIARLESFLKGDVHAEPAYADDCVYCDFRNACRVETTTGLIEIGTAV